ncbi:MAG: hypothetical protein HYV90_01985 [Candidatus Woesebacteria bacterium]|nr:MAG: hypothetical protein HYV90_01985 [Candidatus Woesebacteria bacterium]
MTSEIEIPQWMSRTSRALTGREHRAIFSRDRKAGVEVKKETLIKTLDRCLYYWNFLKIDNALEGVAKAFDLRIAYKLVRGYNASIPVEKHDTAEALGKKILSAVSLKDEDVRTIVNTGIETRLVSEDDSQRFTEFSLALYNDSIFVGSTQPEPSKNDTSYLVSVTQDLGNPVNIKSSEVFRYGLDGYLADLVANYPTFFPKKS